MAAGPLATFARSERTSALLPDSAAFAAAFASLPDWRRRKAESFRFEADRRRSVAAWVLLRRMLAERGIDADALPVAENGYGKPGFGSAAGVHFNLSHAGDRVMAAVSGAEVGCDVERTAPVDAALLGACLVEAERARLAALSGEALDREFFRLWVRKESYVKALGRGLDVDPSGFSALGDPPSPGWVWRDIDFGDGHLGCVCARWSGRDGRFDSAIRLML